MIWTNENDILCLNDLIEQRKKDWCITYGTLWITASWSEVMYDRDTEQNRGSRLLTMSTVEEVEKDVEAYNKYLPVLVPYIPKESPVLRDTAYEVAPVALATILSFHKNLLFGVKSWPLAIYSAEIIKDYYHVSKLHI
ncbi:hypothetical protein Tco_0520786 [Tanacetum coccineum]